MKAVRDWGSEARADGMAWRGRKGWFRLCGSEERTAAVTSEFQKFQRRASVTLQALRRPKKKTPLAHNASSPLSDPNPHHRNCTPPMTGEPPTAKAFRRFSLSPAYPLLHALLEYPTRISTPKTPNPPSTSTSTATSTSPSSRTGASPSPSPTPAPRTRPSNARPRPTESRPEPNRSR